MASSRFSSSIPDLLDVTMTMVAFETINNVRLEVRMSRVHEGGKSDLALTVLAHEPTRGIGEAPPLGSVNVKCSALNLRTLESAVIHALYQLDSQLAAHEFASVLKSA